MSSHDEPTRKKNVALKPRLGSGLLPMVPSQLSTQAQKVSFLSPTVPSDRANAVTVPSYPTNNGEVRTDQTKSTDTASEIDARMAKIQEILAFAGMSLLERASLVAEWVRYAEAKISVSGQLVQKTKGGRPEGGIARAARELRVPGKTEEARRKFVERAVKINTLWDETKEAARAAGLANTQSALLAIAREQSSEAQVSKVREIAACKSAPRRKSVPQVGSDNSQKMVAASAAQTGSEPTNTMTCPSNTFAARRLCR